MRAPGMTLFRMPLTVWALFITAILLLLALPVLSGALIMLLFDRVARHDLLPAGRAGRVRPTRWTNAGGGQALLWQHLFWFYRHPAVYIMILPAMGMVSDIIAGLLAQADLRLPPDGLRDRRASPASGFIVWGHHMFQSGMNPTLGTTFMISTMIIARAVGDQDLQLAGHALGRQHPLHDADAQRDRRSSRCSSSAGCRASSWPRRRSTSTSTTPTSSSPTSTTCSSAASLFGIFAGHLLLVPEDVRPDDERDAGARSTSSLTFIFFNCIVLPDAHPRHARHAAADRRLHAVRAPEGPAADEPVHDDLALRARRRRRSSSSSTSSSRCGAARSPATNPWHANTLEWQTSVAAAARELHGQVPTVYRGPYEYSVPGARRRPLAAERAADRRAARRRRTRTERAAEPRAPSLRGRDGAGDARPDLRGRPRDLDRVGPLRARLADYLRAEPVHVPDLEVGRRDPLRALATG